MKITECDIFREVENHNYSVYSMAEEVIRLRRTIKAMKARTKLEPQNIDIIHYKRRIAELEAESAKV